MDRAERPEPPLAQLHAFAVLAEELHFGRAAARLGIAQPPLSQQIRRLEDKVGHPLFRRDASGVALTPAGAELLPTARRVLGELAGGMAAARAAGEGRTGRLRIGFAASLALTVLPGLLQRFGERWPDVRLDLHEMTTAPQIAALRDGTLDVGLLREPAEHLGDRDDSGDKGDKEGERQEGSDPDLAFRTIDREPFVAVLPDGHRLAAAESVPLADLANEPFVLLPREAGPRLHDQIVGLCVASGFTPRIGQHAVEWQTVCALVGAGLGVSLAPAGIARLRLDGVAFRPVEPDTARTRVAVGWRRRDPGPVVANFLALTEG